jgi:hypothetical protein
VTIEDTERCPRYGAGLVVDVTVGSSPSWMKYRLESLGIRSISNLVDVTNLLLLEYGQPMHAFDLDDVRGAKIIVRRAKPGEKLKTLDGTDRVLDVDDLVIADAEGPSRPPVPALSLHLLPEPARDSARTAAVRARKTPSGLAACQPAFRRSARCCQVGASAAALPWVTRR